MRFSGMPWHPISGSRYQDAPLFTGWFFKPLHSFSRSGLQDAQTTPSPRVGEGGRGDEGQKRPTSPSSRVGEGGRGDEGANTPNLPLRPVWEKGAGGMRGKSVQPPLLPV